MTITNHYTWTYQLADNSAKKIPGEWSSIMRTYDPDTGEQNPPINLANAPPPASTRQGDWFSAVSDFAAGMGDAVSGGLTSKIRQGLGYDDVVNYGSTFYVVGSYAGEGVNAGLSFATPCGSIGALRMATRAVHATQGVAAAIDAGSAFADGDYARGGMKAVQAVFSFGIAGKSCFAAGTPLLTPDGDKPIEQFKVGDLILAAPDEEPNAPPEAREVVELYDNVASLIELKIGGRLIQTTSGHPFFVKHLGWIEAGKLQPGDQFRSHDGRWMALESVRDLQETTHVYNLQVADYHTYFVGGRKWGFSVWAHNTSCDARALGKALKAAGEVRKKGQQAAHIVPTGAFSRRADAVPKAVKAAQDALKSAGIGINSALNGFFAKVGHNGTHTNSYLLKLAELMEQAMADGTVAELLSAIKNARGIL